MICSMESRLLNFSAVSKARRDGERLNICHFAPDLLLAGAPKDHVYGVKVQGYTVLLNYVCHFTPGLPSCNGSILVDVV